MPNKKTDPVIRFWKKVKKTRGCWLWTGCVQAKGEGYGGIEIEGKLVAAHRFSWEIRFGPVPEGNLVCHTCDNRICVKPEHLFLGNFVSNAEDMVRKGRASTWATSHKDRMRRGEQHGRSVLTEKDAKRIIRLQEKGISARDVHALFPQVSYGTIWFIFKGRNWAHLRRK